MARLSHFVSAARSAATMRSWVASSRSACIGTRKARLRTQRSLTAVAGRSGYKLSKLVCRPPSPSRKWYGTCTLRCCTQHHPGSCRAPRDNTPRRSWLRPLPPHSTICTTHPVRKRAILSKTIRTMQFPSTSKGESRAWFPPSFEIRTDEIPTGAAIGRAAPAMHDLSLPCHRTPTQPRFPRIAKRLLENNGYRTDQELIATRLMLPSTWPARGSPGADGSEGHTLSKFPVTSPARRAAPRRCGPGSARRDRRASAG